MNQALELARSALGTTAPNPSVGCIIVKNGIIVGQGVTQKGGRPHAETVALTQAGRHAKNATLYVTLEPCCHTGATPPCTNAIIEAGIKQVVIATKDPFARVNGKGIIALQDAGIKVTYGILEKEATILNAGFFTAQTKKRPWITAKIAMSLDGKIATKSGHSKWITNEQSRQYAHQLRASHDAILVGIGTVLADDPLLTCRLPNVQHNPIRIVLDSQLRIPLNSQLVHTASSTPCWIYSQKNEPRGQAVILPYPTDHSINSIASDLATRGITRLLIEGGSKIFTAFLQAGLIDELICIRAPIIIGNDGVPAFNMQNNRLIEHCHKFSFNQTFTLGGDIVEIYS